MDERRLTATSPPIVVAGDDSPWGRAAVRWAAEHAERTAAPLEVRPVAEDPVGDLLRVSHRAGLLVVPHRGANGTSFGLGRLVLPLADHAACDVAVVRGTAEALRRAHHRVTALLSGDPADDDLALARAVDQARRHRAALRILHATPPLPVRADDPEWPLVHADQVLDGTRHTSLLARMHPHEALGRYDDTDLLVLAGRGPVTRTALHHAPCLVLVAHRYPAGLIPRQPTATDRVPAVR